MPSSPHPLSFAPCCPCCELVRQVWRELEEFNLNAELALESLFVRLRRELALNLVLES